MYKIEGVKCLGFFFQKQQLLKLNVPATFMLVALDEGPGPPIKYQYAELGKLYSVVSQLVRCCDVSSRCQSSSHVSFFQFKIPFCPTFSSFLFQNIFICINLF